MVGSGVKWRDLVLCGEGGNGGNNTINNKQCH